MTRDDDHSDTHTIITVAEPGENIFAKIGLPDAEELEEKAQLLIGTTRFIQTTGISRTKAAKKAGLAPADMSRILRERLENYSVTRLERILNALGMAFTKVISPTKGEDGRGITSVRCHEEAAVPMAIAPHD